MLPSVSKITHEYTHITELCQQVFIYNEEAHCTSQTSCVTWYHDAYSSGSTSMVKLFRRSSNSSSGSSASKDTSENQHFLKQCFIVSLVIYSNAWFTHLIHCRRSTPWISDAFFPSLTLEITCFKSCLRYLTLKFWMIPASQGCNWEVVILISLEGFRVRWSVI